MQQLDDDLREDLRDDYPLEEEWCEMHNHMIDHEVEVAYIQKDPNCGTGSLYAEAVILGKKEEGLLEKLSGREEAMATTELGSLVSGPTTTDYSHTGGQRSQTSTPKQPSPRYAD